MAASEASTTNGFRAADDSDREKGLHRTQTSVTMPSELFEKLYLTPKVPRAGDYNRRFANPTALGFVGWVSLVHTSHPGTVGLTTSAWSSQPLPFQSSSWDGVEPTDSRPSCESSLPRSKTPNVQTSRCP